jgi:hypothetical protein
LASGTRGKKYGLAQAEWDSALFPNLVESEPNHMTHHEQAMAQDHHREQGQSVQQLQHRSPGAPDPSVKGTEHPNDPQPQVFDPVYPLDVPVARPTLAPITLAFGLFLLALGGLVTQWWVIGIGVAVAVWATVTWVRESLASSE